MFFFLKRNNLVNLFEYKIDDILTNLKLGSDKKELIQKFLEEINLFFKERDFKEMRENNKKFKKTIYITFIIILIILILTIIYLIYLFKNSSKIHSIIIFLIGIIVLLIFLIILLQMIFKMDLYFEFNEISYMITKYNDINKLITQWNKDEFEKIRVNVSVPISLNYIQFNIDPFQKIEIKHIDMSKFKKKFYPNKKFPEKSMEEFQNIKKSLKYNRQDIIENFDF